MTQEKSIVAIHNSNQTKINFYQFLSLMAKPLDTDMNEVIVNFNNEQKTIKEWSEIYHTVNNLDKIIYVEGDMFSDVKSVIQYEKIIMPHVCNNQGGWGSGFVVPLGRNYPRTKQIYHESHLQLGENQFCEFDNLTVVNMVAQTLGGKRPLFYNHLVACMEKVLTYATVNNFSTIMAPAFGSGLAGGDWNFIKELIVDCWVKNKLNVVIYYLPGTFDFIES